MQFIGSTTLDWEGKRALKLRNRTNDYVVPPSIFWTNDGIDLRYIEAYVDFAGQVWIRKPAGTQKKLARPYTLVFRRARPGTDQYELISKEVT